MFKFLKIETALCKNWKLLSLFLLFITYKADKTYFLPVVYAAQALFKVLF